VRFPSPVPQDDALHKALQDGVYTEKHTHRHT